MAVKIGSARIDENGNAHGGKAGDQTGREVSTQNWYLHSKGWRVFRCKDPAKAELMAQNMQAACDNPNIGYDQYQRHTLYKAAKLVGFILSRVNTKCETDCSALIRVLLALIGVSVPEEFRTGNMPGYLLKSGMFVELTGDKYQAKSAYLRRGDRILKKGMKGEDVKALQTELMAQKYALPKYGADGDFGGETLAAVKAFQGDHALEVDGEFGPESLAALRAGQPAQGKTVLVTGGLVNVRAAPGTSGRIMGVVRKGETLEYQGERIDVDGAPWLLVVYLGANAWISGKYAEVA